MLDNVMRLPRYWRATGGLLRVGKNLLSFGFIGFLGPLGPWKSTKSVKFLLKKTNCKNDIPSDTLKIREQSGSMIIWHCLGHCWLLSALRRGVCPKNQHCIISTLMNMIYILSIIRLRKIDIFHIPYPAAKKDNSCCKISKYPYPVSDYLNIHFWKWIYIQIIYPPLNIYPEDASFKMLLKPPKNRPKIKPVLRIPPAPHSNATLLVQVFIIHFLLHHSVVR